MFMLLYLYQFCKIPSKKIFFVFVGEIPCAMYFVSADGYTDKQAPKKKLEKKPSIKRDSVKRNASSHTFAEIDKMKVQWNCPIQHMCNPSDFLIFIPTYDEYFLYSFHCVIQHPFFFVCLVLFFVCLFVFFFTKYCLPVSMPVEILWFCSQMVNWNQSYIRGSIQWLYLAHFWTCIVLLKDVLVCEIWEEKNPQVYAFLNPFLLGE